MSLLAHTLNRTPQEFDRLARSNTLSGIYYKDPALYKQYKESYLKLWGEQLPYSISWIGNKECVLSFSQALYPFSEEELVHNYSLLCSYAGLPHILEYPVINTFESSLSRRFDVVHPDKVLEFKTEKITTHTITDIVCNRRYLELIDQTLKRPLYFTSPSGIDRKAEILLSHIPNAFFVDLRDLYVEVWETIVQLHTSSLSSWYLDDLRFKFPLLSQRSYF